MSKIKILIATHKEAEFPQNEIFLPIQVGKKNAKVKINIQGDDEGENISEKNPQYCELTAIYWAWKNLKEYEYIGLFHYRRYISFEKTTFITRVVRNVKYYISKFPMNIIYPGDNYIHWSSIETNFTKQKQYFSNDFPNEMKLSLGSNEIYAIKKIKFSNTNIKTFWSTAVSLVVMNILETIISDKFPLYLNSYRKQMQGNEIHPCNIFIFKKYIFEEYSEFVFSTLSELEASLLNVNITPLPRTVGYVGEVLTSTFILYKIANGHKIKELSLMNID